MPSNDERRGVVTLRVPSMDCPSCAETVSTRLDGEPGVVKTTTQPVSGRTTVEYDPDIASAETIAAAVEDAGYEVVDRSVDEDEDTGTEHSHDHGAPSIRAVWTSERAIRTFIGGALFAIVIALRGVALFGGPALDPTIFSTPGHQYTATDLLLLGTILAAGEPILRNGVRSLVNRRLDIQFLMTIAILAATGLTIVIPSESLFIEAAALATLFNLAELLEDHSVTRARRSIADLVDLAPETARVERDGDVVTVPVSEVQVGETVVVDPGDKIPVDGTVVDGESAVDQSPITGESIPVDKTAGEEVYAGTIVENGHLRIESTTKAGATTIDKVIDLVADADAEQTEREQFVNTFARYYTPIVVVAAVLTAALPPLVLSGETAVGAGALSLTLTGDAVTWFVRGITLLVVACPCAFVISTPVSVVSGVTSAANNGVLIKGGSHLETMGDVDAVAFDKTGTLTTGELQVTDVVPLNGHDETDVLQCARGVERHTEHPIGQAIVEYAEPKLAAAAAGSGAPEVSGFEAMAGRGVQADLDGTTHFAGAPALFDELGFDLDHVHLPDQSGQFSGRTRDRCRREGCLDLIDDVVTELQGDGKTVVLVGTDEQIEGVIALADSPRPEAQTAVERLRAQGITPIMLTGDNERAGNAVAAELGIDDVRAELLPEEKVAAVQSLQEEYGTVAMVGDGINDTPALATADVGVAMGAAGTDAAIETADIALLGDEVLRVPYLTRLSSKANSVIRQNIWSSLGVKAALAVGIPLGQVSLIVAVLAGDVGMTSAVTGNAMRLSRVEPE